MLKLNGTMQRPYTFLNYALTSCCHDMTSKLGCMHSVRTFWTAYVVPVHILVPKLSSWSFQVITTGLVSNSQSFQVPWVSIVKCWRHIISNNASSHACYRHKWRSLERNFGFPEQKWCKTCHDSKKENKIGNIHKTLHCDTFIKLLLPWKYNNEFCAFLSQCHGQQSQQNRKCCHRDANLSWHTQGTHASTSNLTNTALAWDLLHLLV